VKTDVTDREAAAPGSPSALSVGVLAVVLTGSRKGHSKLVGVKLSIGKSKDNDLVLSDKSVSRHHCELLRTPEGIRVRDCGSTNGTMVDGVVVREALLSPGSVLKLGQIEIAIRPNAQKLELLPSPRSSFGQAVGASLAMRSIFAVLEHMAPGDATVLLLGETGTGKDVLARSIASESRRSKGPFVVVDCAAVARNLLESELFGHERGAFTGALATRKGAFELADRGTLFLDEVGDLPLDLQPKLLRVLETRQFRRVGGNKTLKSDVRIVAATKHDLARGALAGTFREDLYFRLAVVPVVVPPLRERRDDIPLLCERIVAGHGKPTLTIPTETMQSLMAEPWPGNVRELRNVLDRAVVHARAGGQSELRITASHVRMHPYVEARATFDRRYAESLVVRHHGDVAAAAREAGITPDELARMLESSERR
jgi:transcriptional regulator with GAF, ATPase, and Fis domain